MRIVSLLPAATEILCSLGLQEKLVGVSHECDFPSSIAALPKLTRSKISPQLSSQDIDTEVRKQLNQGESLYALDAELLEHLQPDIVVTQSLCEVCAISLNEVHQACGQLSSKPDIVDVNPTGLDEVFDAIRMIAVTTECLAAGDELVTALQSRISQVQKNVSEDQSPDLRVLMLEWISPPFSAGHWNPELIKLAGGTPLLVSENAKSTQLTWEQIALERVDLIVCACCGFDANRTASDWLEAVNEVPDAASTERTTQEIWALDGSQYFNRSGPRLVDSLELIAYLIRPKSQPRPANFDTIARSLKKSSQQDGAS